MLEQLRKKNQKQKKTGRIKNPPSFIKRVKYIYIKTKYDVALGQKQVKLDLEILDTEIRLYAAYNNNNNKKKQFLNLQG